MHFPIGNLTKIMYPIMATNSYKIQTFVIFQPFGTWRFTLWKFIGHKRLFFIGLYVCSFADTACRVPTSAPHKPRRKRLFFADTACRVPTRQSHKPRRKRTSLRTRHAVSLRAHHINLGGSDYLCGHGVPCPYKCAVSLQVWCSITKERKRSSGTQGQNLRDMARASHIPLHGMHSDTLAPRRQAIPER